MTDDVAPAVLQQAPYERSDARFRPAAYWFWSRLPSAEEMRSQLIDFRDKGFGTILIQARLSMPREIYLSDAFLDAYDEAITLMGELGLVAGLYDDYNWISGHAGGRTVEGADHLRERHLFWATVDENEGIIDGIEATMAVSLGPQIAGWLYEGGKPCFGDWEIVAALVHAKADGRAPQTEDVTQRLTITQTGDTGCRFALDEPVPQGKRLTVFLSARCLTSRIVNYLMPEAGKRFVEVGLEPFAQRLSGSMPDPLAFLFFDQPAPGFYRWRRIDGNLANSLLFEPMLANRVTDVCQAPFSTVLLALLRDVGADTARLRCKFYECYTQQIHESFFGPLRAFAKRHGLRFTGHEVLPHIGGFALNGGFPSIDPRVAPAVDFFGLDALRDETAVDANNFAAQLAPRLGDSVARAHGRSRTMTELYVTAERTSSRAAGQWELTPATLRAQMIRLHMLGTRQIVLHALYLTDGDDDDTSLFANPRFDFPPGLNFEPWWPHFAAIADETARLSAFIEDASPAPAVGVLYPLHTAWAEGPRHAHASHFGSWCEALYALGCDYLIIDEESIGSAEPAGDRLRVNGAELSAIVLPAARVLKTVLSHDILRRFEAAGGRVWVSGEPPSMACDGLPADPLSLTMDGSPNREDVAAHIARLPEYGPAISAPPGIRAHIAGQDAHGFWRVVLFNENNETARARLSLGTGFEYEIWNPETATGSGCYAAGALDLALETQDLTTLRLRETKNAPDTLVDSGWSAGTERSVTLADGWTIRMDGQVRDIDVDKGWERQGHASFSGTGIYERTIDIAHSSRLALDLPGVACAVEVLLDRQLVGARSRPPFRIDLGRVEAGSHLLQIRVANTAANRYYAHTPYAGQNWPDESGLTRPPRLLFLRNEPMER